MPTYEFICEKCNREFSRTMSLKEYEKQEIVCPACGALQVCATFLQ